MRILDRYMLRSFTMVFLWCLGMFVIIAVISDIFSYIDKIVTYRIPIASIVAFYVFYAPALIIQVVPIAVLIGTIYILGDLNKHNEIIAMKASGVSLWRIIGPLLMVGTIISGIVFIVNDRVVPTSSRIAQIIRKDELEKHKSTGGTPKIIENVAVYGSGNKLIFARTYDAGRKTLEDIIIHRHDKHLNLISKTTAKQGRWDGKQWIFYDTITYTVDNSGRILGEPQFDAERTMDIEERPSDFIKREWRSEFMSYRELKRYIENFKGSGIKLLRTLEVELHYKISFVFISLIIILIASPFALITTRGGIIVGVGMGIAIGLLYYGTIAVSLALGKLGPFPALVSAWLPNLLFACLGVYLINKKS